MANYLNFTSTMGATVGTTQNLANLGATFKEQVEALVRQVEDLDVPANFPRDQFTDRLLENYTEENRLALRESARNVSAWVTSMADYLMDAIHGFDDTDVSSGTALRQSDPT